MLAFSFPIVDRSYNPVTTPTQNQALDNTIRNNAVNNVSGDGHPDGYQAGISDQGDGDIIKGNSICGIGYTPVAVPPPYLYVIDITDTNNATVANNTTCSATGPVTDAQISCAVFLSRTGSRIAHPVASVAERFEIRWG